MVFLWGLSLIFEGKGTEYLGIPFLYNFTPIGILVFFIVLLLVCVFASYRIWIDIREERLLEKKHGKNE